jgi:hypothetical protein
LSFAALEDKVKSFFPEDFHVRIRHGDNVIGCDDELMFAYGKKGVIIFIIFIMRL